MNENLREAAYKSLVDRDVPPSTAERAADVIGKDNPEKPNFGRTEEDQKNVSDAVTWMNAKKISSFS